MNNFTLFNYAQLSNTIKVEFNKALALGLATMLDDIKSDGDLNAFMIDEFIASSGLCSNSAYVVENLYFRITSGIQVGSGNQNLFLGILAKYTECWEEVTLQS